MRIKKFSVSSTPSPIEMEYHSSLHYLFFWLSVLSTVIQNIYMDGSISRENMHSYMYNECGYKFKNCIIFLFNSHTILFHIISRYVSVCMKKKKELNYYME